MSFLTSPRIFMTVITILFGMSAVRQLIARDWPQFWYCMGAVVLNIAVLEMGKK